MTSLALLLFIPLSLALKYPLGAGPIWLFVSGVIAVAVLADWVRKATEQLAEQAGSAIGGLVNVSFGSIAELVLALFVLIARPATVVKAQIAGSIIGTSLLGLGLAMLVGGLYRERQTFNRANTGLLSTLLILVVVALLLPAVFDLRAHAAIANTAHVDEWVSIGVSIVLLVLYGANLVFTLVTHRDVFAGDEPRGASAWSLGRSLAVLIVGTIFIAAESELVSDAVAETATLLH